MPAHAVEEARGEAQIAEEMIVEEVEMLAGQTLNLAERVIHLLAYRRTYRP